SMSVFNLLSLQSVNSNSILSMNYIPFYLAVSQSIGSPQANQLHNKLNLSMEHPYLLELIRAHHIEDIPVYLNRIKGISVHAEPYDHQAQKEIDRAFSKAINTPRLTYANNVLFEIIDDEVFINHTVNVDPYFYTKIIQCLNTRRGDYSHMVERYLEILMQNKNYHFFREIKNTLELVEGGKYKLDEKNEILYSLFSDIKVAEFNYVWRPVANVAIWELQNQNSTESQFLKGANFEEQFDFELSNTKMKTAIHFFDIMIRESIYQKAEWHMWLFYYHRFVEVLIANIPDNYYDQDDHEPTLNHKLIHDIIENMLDWLDVGVELKINNLSIDICRCIGKCIYEITSSDILSDKVKVRPLDRLLKKYFDYGWNPEAEFQMLELEKTLLMPSDKLKWGDQEENVEKYKHATNLAWRNFDKIPYSAYGGNIAYNKFHPTLLDQINQI
ncbi:MAG: hypothetical protein J0M29_17565, partial [Chitinophagales bacterium]|nr:hypothetical protein [Chitinophagales bacterium]